MLILWEWYIYYEGKSFFFSRKYNFKYCVIDGGFHFCWWFKLRFSFIWNFQKFDRNFNEWNDYSPWKNPSCTAMTLPTLSSCIMSSWFTLFLFILDVHNLSLLLFFFILCWSWHVYLPPTLQDVDTLVMKVGVVYHHYLCPTCVITMVLL